MEKTTGTSLARNGLKPLHGEPEVYVMHYDTDTKPKVRMTIDERRKKERCAEQDIEYQHEQKWMESSRKKLRMIVSAHVDDLKGGASKKDAENFLAFLNKKFGTCKSEWNKFAHTGVEHERLADGIFCHQFSYAQQLNAMSHPRGDQTSEDLVDEEMHEAYSSLLGGVAWLALTRADVAVWTQALQRRGHAPRHVDCYRLNKVLSWIKRHPLGIMYRRIECERVRILGFTDAAYKTQPDDNTALALRGLAVLLAPDDTVSTQAWEKQEIIQHAVAKPMMIHLLSWTVRKLKRVVRSTFAAELNALIDTIESLLLLQLMLHQCYCGTDESAEELLIKQDYGKLYPPIDIFVDAKSVTEAISAKEVCTPSEQSLKVHLITIRDRLLRGLLRTISWTDTRDMVADALTKGTIERTMIEDVMKGGLKIQHKMLTFGGKRA